MAERIIECIQSGQTFVFSDEWNTTDGKVKQLSYKILPKKTVAAHVHPASSQYFKVISGELTVKVNGKRQIIKAGEEVKTSIGAEHAQWNDGDIVAEVIEGYDPPVDIEPFFTILPHALKSKNIFKIMVFFSDFSYVVTSRWHIGKFIIWSLGRIGKALGYKSWYLKYIQHLKCTDFNIKNI